MTEVEHGILERLKQGDESVIEILFQTFYVGLCTYACDFLQDKQAAEDLVSDAFVRLWEKRQDLRIETSLRAYLFRLIHNKCVNYLDHKKVVRNYSEKSQELLSEEMRCYLPGKESPFTILVSQEVADSIDKVISKLPAKCRKIFEMSRFDGLKYNEIARELGISLPTVKTQMSIALSRLRDALQEYRS
jgi:RNA polymerase sigma-70 factor (family 1)